MTYKSRKVGYLRVSRADQCFDRQIDGLKAFCNEMVIEQISAVSKLRPIFDGLIAELQAGDTLVVYDLDRAFRSTIDAVTQAERLRLRGINFQIVTLSVDTATDDGMLVYTFMAAIAEHERKRLARRTREGLAAARERGKRLGRPPKLTNKQVRLVKQKLASGKIDLGQLAADHGVHPVTLTRSLLRDTQKPDQR